MHPDVSVSLREIQEEWSIEDLADCHEAMDYMDDLMPEIPDK